MKLKFLIFHFSFLILTACGVTKPVATTHTERIETNLHPIPVGADTIEIVLSHTDDLSHTECTDNTEDALTPSAPLVPLKQGDNIASLTYSSPVLRVHLDGSSAIQKTDNLERFALPENLGREKMRISSTRGVNISRHETDTTSTLRITLRPDTVFVPYTNHIRSDTIVVPDRICQTKLQKTQTANVLLILIIIVVTIIFFLKDRKT